MLLSLLPPLELSQYKPVCGSEKEVCHLRHHKKKFPIFEMIHVTNGHVSMLIQYEGLSEMCLGRQLY